MDSNTSIPEVSPVTPAEIGATMRAYGSLFNALPHTGRSEVEMETYEDKIRKLNRNIQNFRAALEICGDDAAGREELFGELREFSQQLTLQQMEHKGDMAPLLFAAGIEPAVTNVLSERQQYALAMSHAQKAIAEMLGS